MAFLEPEVLIVGFVDGTIQRITPDGRGFTQFRVDDLAWLGDVLGSDCLVR